MISFGPKAKKTDGSVSVLVVDDSAVVRQVMQGVLSADPKIRVRVAADPIITTTQSNLRIDARKATESISVT